MQNCLPITKKHSTLNFGEKDMDEKYLIAVETIKSAILRSQSRAARYTNAEMLSLYYSIGGYVSDNSRKGTWGTGAIEEISNRLRAELPGLRGFSPENIKLMRRFYEEWHTYLQPLKENAIDYNSVAVATELKKPKENLLSHIDQINSTFHFSTEDFTAISFSHHIEILHKTKILMKGSSIFTNVQLASGARPY